tara:strand:- start:23 stop:661 length:639 start_codon:yes stop_codon:yes gene_type:complete
MIGIRPPIVSALEALKPKAQWTLAGDSYANLQWLDSSQTKPTEQQVEEKIVELKYQEEVNVYQEKRKLEYPDWEDQLDQIYHSGIDVWKSDIKTIKDKYPKQTMDATELQKRKDAAVFEMQKRNYKVAVARLAQYELSAGVKGVVGTEKVWNPTDGTGVYIDQDIIDYIIEPLPLTVNGERNPLVVQDEAEREAAQEIINNTPQVVIDSINT